MIKTLPEDIMKALAHLIMTHQATGPHHHRAAAVSRAVVPVAAAAQDGRKEKNREYDR